MMSMRTQLTILFTAFSFFCSYSQDSASSKTLDEVVITTTKYPLKTSETGKVITVINREQLERSGGKDLSQLLNEQAGIAIAGANSNPGKEKAIFLRGAKPEYTLIIVDGVPVYDATATASNFDIRMLPLDNIERIEILKGSQSTLYGSDAIAGVINIITRKGGNKTFSPFAGAGYGTYDTRKLNAGVNGSKGIINYNAGVSHIETNGISEANDKFNVGGFDKDGYEQNSFNAGLGVNFKFIKINPYLRYSKYNGNSDADVFTDDKDYSFNLRNIQAGVKNEIFFGSAKINVLYNYTDTRRNYLNDSLIKSFVFDGYSKGYYNGQEHFVDAYVHVPLVDNLSFTGGVDYRNANTSSEYTSIYKYEYDGNIYSDTYISNINSDSAKQNQLGIYGSLAYRVQAFNIEGGLRHNHHSVYGNNAVFNVNPAYAINKNLQLFVNISSAYKVPTLYQLYSEYRNPVTSLKPEKAITYEGGFKYSKAFFKSRVTVFKREVKNVIAFYTDPNTYASYYINQDKQNDWGFEIEPSFNFNKLQVVLSYSHVDGEVTTNNGVKDTSYFNLLRRPKNMFNASVNYQFTKKLFASAGLQSFGKRADVDFSTSSSVKLAAYTLVNFYAEYKILESLRIFADLRNIGNTSYVEIFGYNTQGFNLYGGFRVSL
jgi:vitamin B12 transporter